MAQAAADVHGADPTALRTARAETVDGAAFRDLVATMVAVVRADFRAQDRAHG